ncbi:hypothetical protein [Marispirochaeta aestuarii]|uniref:hypothetical protein n=1 Tax=Marispirochaeta aestuarii TaxID=1963862 RepID=UPI0029C8EE43|nr:hypothetical protein [Marispirochaeta aestuarii]
MQIDYKKIHRKEWLVTQEKRYGRFTRDELDELIKHKISVAEYFLIELGICVRGESPVEPPEDVQKMLSGNNEDWNDFVQALRFIEVNDKKCQQLFSMFSSWLLTLPKARKNLKSTDARKIFLPSNWGYRIGVSPTFNDEVQGVWDSVFSNYEKLWREVFESKNNSKTKSKKISAERRRIPYDKTNRKALEELLCRLNGSFVTLPDNYSFDQFFGNTAIQEHAIGIRGRIEVSHKEGLCSVAALVRFLSCEYGCRLIDSQGRKNLELIADIFSFINKNTGASEFVKKRSIARYLNYPEPKEEVTINKIIGYITRESESFDPYPGEDLPEDEDFFDLS